MVTYLTTHVFDLLQNDSRLLDGGTVLTENWPGVQRIGDTNPPVKGDINLFETMYANDANTARPAIYRGMKGVEGFIRPDKEMKVSVLPAQHLEYRVLVLPLVIVVNSTDSQSNANALAAQLLSNCEKILISHLIENNYWWKLEFSEDLGGRRVFSSATATAGYTEAMAILPVKLRYAWTLNSPA